MAKITGYLVCGTSTRFEEEWCKVCVKTSIWGGPLWYLSDSGVSPAGSFHGCMDCKDWVYYDVNGKVREVRTR